MNVRHQIYFKQIKKIDHYLYSGLLRWLSGKESTYQNAGDLGLITGLGRSLGEGNDN